MQAAQVVLLGAVEAVDPAQAPGVRERLAEALLDAQLGGVRQLEGVGAEELDPVVGVGVVRSADDSREVEAIAAQQQRRRGRRQHAAQQRIAAGGGDAGGQ